MPRLSICIPTYNRSRFLAELLDSVVAQYQPDIEVIVSDDASKDDTALVASRYENQIANFHFIQQPENIGLDKNFLAVVEAATGDYIWLMGDDDRIELGGLARVLLAIDTWPGVAGLTLGVLDYDVDMLKVIGVRAIPPTQLLKSSSALFGDMAELLGFMSALVIDREKWKKVALDKTSDQFRNYYIQVYIIGRVMEMVQAWGVVHEPCVAFRTGNDQLKSKFGWLQRLKIDVLAYGQIANALFGDDRRTRQQMRRRIFNTHIMARIHNAKTAPGGTPHIMQATGYLISQYYDLPRCLIVALPTLLAPSWSIRQARAMYKRFAQNSGAARARKFA